MVGRTQHFHRICGIHRHREHLTADRQRPQPQGTYHFKFLHGPHIIQQRCRQQQQLIRPSSLHPVSHRHSRRYRKEPSQLLHRAGIELRLYFHALQDLPAAIVIEVHLPGRVQLQPGPVQCVERDRSQHADASAAGRKYIRLSQFEAGFERKRICYIGRVGKPRLPDGSLRHKSAHPAAQQPDSGVNHHFDLGCQHPPKTSQRLNRRAQHVQKQLSDLHRQGQLRY